MEPCCGSGPGLGHPLRHSDAVNVEIESVSKDHSVDDDDGRNLSTTFAGMGLSEDGTKTFVQLLCTTHHACRTRRHHRPIMASHLSLSRKAYSERSVECRRRRRRSHHLFIPRQGRKMRSAPLRREATGPSSPPPKTGPMSLICSGPILKFVTSSDVFQF
jgi:hypothetical protein